MLHKCGWNPWHGCVKISEGCRHCYVYRFDSRYGKNSREVTKTAAFSLPIQRKRDGSYKIPSGSLVYTCFSSDFFLDTADAWRPTAWEMIRLRSDLHFLFITKRIERMSLCIPPDWGNGYENVTIGCTIENQEMCNHRLPYFLQAPITHKIIVCEPLLEHITLPTCNGIEQVITGGESGYNARPCHYEWILHLRAQCAEQKIGFYFKQTGALFIKDGITYHIARHNQIPQARKADIDLPQTNTIIHLPYSSASLWEK